jgi:hypothetical protein
VGLESRARTPENPAATNNVRVKGRVVLSDDESDTIAPLPSRRRSKVALRTESPEREIDQAAMALMDIDDGLLLAFITIHVLIISRQIKLRKSSTRHLRMCRPQMMMKRSKRMTLIWPMGLHPNPKRLGRNERRKQFRSAEMG